MIKYLHLIISASIVAPVGGIGIYLSLTTENWWLFALVVALFVIAAAFLTRDLKRTAPWFANWNSRKGQK